MFSLAAWYLILWSNGPHARLLPDYVCLLLTLSVSDHATKIIQEHVMQALHIVQYKPWSGISIDPPQIRTYARKLDGITFILLSIFLRYCQFNGLHKPTFPPTSIRTPTSQVIQALSFFLRTSLRAWPSSANLRIPSWSLSKAISSSRSAHRKAASSSTKVTFGSLPSDFAATESSFLGTGTVEFFNSSRRLGEMLK